MKEERGNRNSPIEEEKHKEKMIAMLRKKISIGIQEKGISDYADLQQTIKKKPSIKCSKEQEAYQDNIQYNNKQKCRESMITVTPRGINERLGTLIPYIENTVKNEH
ncbi:8485_t:CDS:2, partial [Gigaspora margarita]